MTIRFGREQYKVVGNYSNRGGHWHRFETLDDATRRQSWRKRMHKGLRREIFGEGI